MTTIIVELPADGLGRRCPDGLTLNVSSVPRVGESMLVRPESAAHGNLYRVASVTHEVRADIKNASAYVGVVVVRLAAPGDP